MYLLFASPYLYIINKVIYDYSIQMVDILILLQNVHLVFDFIC